MTHTKTILILSFIILSLGSFKSAYALGLKAAPKAVVPVPVAAPETAPTVTTTTTQHIVAVTNRPSRANINLNGLEDFTNKLKDKMGTKAKVGNFENVAGAWIPSEETIGYFYGDRVKKMVKINGDIYIK